MKLIYLPPIPARRKRHLRVVGASLTVPNPEIKEVMEMSTGEVLPVEEVIGIDYDTLIQRRLLVSSSLHADRPLYRCSKCLAPVFICGQPTSNLFYFKHKYEDGNCPAITRGSLNRDEIDARKYNGAKESALHQSMKEWIARCLEQDHRFASVEPEPIWKGKISGEWRRPDVRAIYKGIPIAFEIQLSTTYLDVIAGRREFYLKNGGLLFWIFALFDDEHRRLTEDDVFYNNNQNAFVVNDETVHASMKSKAFMFECVWAEPRVNGCADMLHRKIINFDEIILDINNQQAYYFNYADSKNKLIAIDVLKKEQLRSDIESWIGRGGPNQDQEAWVGYARRLKEIGINVPLNFSKVNRYAIIGLYSAKHGYPYGQGKKRLVEIAHHIAGGYKDNLIWFMHGVNFYGRREQLRAEGDTKKWIAKRNRCAEEYRLDRRPFEPNRGSQPLVEFLFPELSPLP